MWPPCSGSCREERRSEPWRCGDAFRYRLDESAKISGAKAYRQHVELLADPAVDAVVHRHTGPLACAPGHRRRARGQRCLLRKTDGPLDPVRSEPAVLRGDPAAQTRGADRQPGQLQPRLAKGQRVSPERRYRPSAVGQCRLLSLRRLGRAHAHRRSGSQAGPRPGLGGIPGRRSQGALLGATILQLVGKYLDYAGGPCTDLLPHLFTPFVSAIGLKFPARACGIGGHLQIHHLRSRGTRHLQHVPRLPGETLGW